jgi:sentrin-specific protease 7
VTAKQIPQQDNFSDCGLFLLGYVEKFLESPEKFVEKVVERREKVIDKQQKEPASNPSGDPL